MHIIDFIILALITIGIFRGFWKGLVVELFSLLALILGIALCLYINPSLVASFQKWVGGGEWFSYVFYILIFLITYGLVFLLGKVLEQLLKLTGLNIFNRLAGSVFSGLKVLFLLSTILWVTSHFALLPEDTFAESVTMPVVVAFAPGLLESMARFLPFLDGLVYQTESFLEQILLEFNEKEDT